MSFFFFFFSSRRRHTRSTRDWSSDVCSSDLLFRECKRAEYLTAQVFEVSPDGVCILGRDYRCQRANAVIGRIWGMPPEKRSEERRVGKECRSRWSRDQ